MRNESQAALDKKNDKLIENFCDNFYDTIQEKIVTMEGKAKNKGAFAGNDIYDTE